MLLTILYSSLSLYIGELYLFGNYFQGKLPSELSQLAHLGELVTTRVSRFSVSVISYPQIYLFYRDTRRVCQQL
jgi:hypothetical protein